MLVYNRYSKNRIIIANLKKINTLPQQEIKQILHTIETFCNFIVPTEAEYREAIAEEERLVIIREENRIRNEFIENLQRNAIIAAAKAGDISAVRYMTFHC